MAERFNQLKVMPMDGFTVTKAADSPTGRPRLKIEGFVSRPVPDFDNEIVEVGFFDRYMPEFLANPQMYWCHDGDGQGLWRTMEARPDEGYYGVGELIHLGGDDDDRRFAQVEEGIVRSLSVGFWAYHTPEYGYADENNVWHWTQNGRLMEVSPCTIGACPGAGFTLAKSMGVRLEGSEKRKTRVHCERGKAWGGLSAAEVSDQIYSALNPSSSAEPTAWVYDLYEDYCIVRDWQADKFYRIPYTVMDGSVVLGEAIEVTRVWVEAKASEVRAAQSGDEREEARALKDVQRLADAQESLGNIVAHWAKDGGGPSAEVLDHAVRSITTGLRVVKAGRVLSAENRQAIDGAIAALQDVCARDDEKGGAHQEPDSDVDKPKTTSGPTVLRVLDPPTVVFA